MNSNSKHLNRITIASLLVALGIIYGDIGTSPLYVLKAVVGERQIDEVLVYGGVSCIFWTLVFQTTIKYIWLTLRQITRVKAVCFLCMHLVRRYGKFGYPNNPRCYHLAGRWHYYSADLGSICY